MLDPAETARPTGHARHNRSGRPTAASGSERPHRSFPASCQSTGRRSRMGAEVAPMPMPRASAPTSSGATRVAGKPVSIMVGVGDDHVGSGRPTRCSGNLIGHGLSPDTHRFRRQQRKARTRAAGAQVLGTARAVNATCRGLPLDCARPRRFGSTFATRQDLLATDDCAHKAYKKTASLVSQRRGGGEKEKERRNSFVSVHKIDAVYIQTFNT